MEERRHYLYTAYNFVTQPNIRNNTHIGSTLPFSQLPRLPSTIRLPTQPCKFSNRVPNINLNLSACEYIRQPATMTNQQLFNIRNFFQQNSAQNGLI